MLAEHSVYTGAANRFLTGRLNTSYRELEADQSGFYDAALYWRFLLEQFDDIGIMRAALEEMAVHFDANILNTMGSVMDRAFARFDGLFHTFEESLIAFARANYALRLENGRALAGFIGEWVGFYDDRAHVYQDPPLSAQLDYGGAQLEHGAGIPASYGMDFLDVSLDPGVHDQAPTITLQGEGAGARFNVQIWRLRRGPRSKKLGAITPRPEIVPQNRDNAHVFVIPRLDRTKYDGLALIITRLDTNETPGSSGHYRITLDSTRYADGDTGIE